MQRSQPLRATHPERKVPHRYSHQDRPSSRLDQEEHDSVCNAGFASEPPRYCSPSLRALLRCSRPWPSPDEIASEARSRCRLERQPSTRSAGRRSSEARQVAERKKNARS